MCTIRCCPHSSTLHKTLTIFTQKVVPLPRINLDCHFSNSTSRKFKNQYSSCRAKFANASGTSTAPLLVLFEYVGNLSYFKFKRINGMGRQLERDSKLSDSLHQKLRLIDEGLDEVLMGYIFGKQRATEVAHSVWKHVVQKGDTIVDATCGNGYDTLAMLKMVMDDSGRGRVYGMDIQEDAVRNTSSLLDLSLDLMERKSIKLFTVCHSKIMEVLPKHSSVRLVAFNLGYLPGGNKEIITQPQTTLLALEAAREVLVPGGLISLVVYLGHPGGREEYETIVAFASNLSAESWTCSQIQMLNRPTAPILIFLFKR